MDKKDPNEKYCQSCGMPLPVEADHLRGTLTDHSPSDEFCFYCLREGRYTVDYTMEQMIDVWVKYTEKYNGYAGTSYGPEELRERLSQRLPTLKRWKQKMETESVHHQSVNRVLSYINRHLGDELNSITLSDIAGLSSYHFRKIFKDITGENIGSYVRRLRLENIAYRLLSSKDTVRCIAEESYYQDKHSFSKAFRKHFGVSPSVYRKRHREFGDPDEKEEVKFGVRTENIKDWHIVAIGLDAKIYKSREAYRSLWKQLIHYAEIHHCTKGKYVSVSLDDPRVTARGHCRFFLGITAEETSDISGRFCRLDIPDGHYAVFTFQGSYTLLPALYRNLYTVWLPSHGYRQKGPLSFETYLNTPTEVPYENLITEIYIPIEKLK